MSTRDIHQYVAQHAATPEAYASTADALVARIQALIPERPEVLDLKDAWGLFKVVGFECDDLQPSLYQAQWALARAQANHREATR